MYSLNLPLIRLRAFSQRVGDGGLTWRVTVLGGNGDDAFLFWATCSTGTSMVTGGSTGAVGGRVDPDFDDRGVDVWVGYICLGPVLVVLVGEAGLRLPYGTATGGLATSFGHPPPPRLGWRRHKRRYRRRQFSCRFWFPLGRPSRPLPPLVSINQRDVPRLPPKVTRNSVSWPKVANIAPKVGWGGWGG